MDRLSRSGKPDAIYRAAVLPKRLLGVASSFGADDLAGLNADAGGGAGAGGDGDGESRYFTS